MDQKKKENKNNRSSKVNSKLNSYEKDNFDLREAKLSMIQDTETINECDTVQDENLNGSLEEG